MAGRRRRPSNSTVATADDVKPRYLKESKVIRPLPAETPPEEWTSFVLDDAVILNKDGVTLANAVDILNANVTGPYILRGRLEVDEDQRERLVNRKISVAEIEIRNSNDKSIGYGPLPVLWMSGSGAWYEINPSAAFRPTYDNLCRAITLYYALIAIYEERAGHKKAKSRRKLTSNFDIDELFFKYATTVGDGIVLSEVYDLCDKHARFLLRQFIKDNDGENFHWSDMSICPWLQKRHPKIHQEVIEAATNPVIPPRMSSPDSTSQDDEESAAPIAASRRANRSRSGDDQDTTMEDAPQHKTLSMRGRPRTGATPTLPSPVVGDIGDPFTMFLNLVEQIGDEIDLHKIKTTTLKTRLHARCRISKYESVKEMTVYFAQQLLDNLSLRFRQSPLWQDLQEYAANPPARYEFLELQKLPYQLTPRNKAPSVIPRNTAGKIALPVEEYESDTPPHNDSKKRRGRPAGKLATYRPAGVSKKRIPDDDDDEDSGRARKSAKMSHRYIVEDDEEEDSDASSEAEAIVRPTAASLDADSSAKPSQGTRVAVRAEPIPSMSPKGPNGTWVCEEENCNHIVRSADDEEGKAAIQAHFEAHAASAAKIELALAEGSKGHQPISHLLSKIRAMGQKKKEDKQVFLNGDLVPQPIKRGLLV